ncbi:hypothetical protein [Methanobacterium subterraneum]|nr:hypothetical protein [Methanobacterium subterraneum]
MSIKNLNKFETDDKILSLDDMVNKLQDPDILYNYIQQAHKNCQKSVDLRSISDDKKKSVNLLYKLEVFRATMQYIEEFGIYFLAYTEGEDGIAKKITQTMPKDVIDDFFKYLINNKHDEFSQKHEFANYDELLEDIFGYNRISNVEQIVDNDKLCEMIKESVRSIKYYIDSCIRFYIEYLELYNAIKHGTRIFPSIGDKVVFAVGSEEHSFDIVPDSFTAICKASGTDDVYSLLYHANILINSSLLVSQRIHPIFSLMRENVKNKLSKSKKFDIQFFHDPKNQIIDEEKFIKVMSKEGVLLLPHYPELEKFLGNSPSGECAFNLTLKGRTMYLHFDKNKGPSQDYPIVCELSSKMASGISPKLHTHMSFDMDIDKLSVTQYINLLKLHSASENGEIKSIQAFDDVENKQIGRKLEFNDFNFPEIPQIHSMDMLKFLSTLEKITNQVIPVPSGISPQQRSIITENIGKLKDLRQEEIIELVAELEKKPNKMRYTNFSIQKLNSNSEQICYKELDSLIGTWFTLNFLDTKTEQFFIENYYEIPNVFFVFYVNGIDGDPDELIKNIKSFVEEPFKNKYPEFRKASEKLETNPKFDYEFRYSYKEPDFWSQGHQIDITIKLLD